MRRSLAALLLAVSVLAGCADDVFVPPDPTEIDFAPQLNIDFTRMTETSSGLWYEDLQVGEGELPVAGDSVFVLYSGWLPNGTLFDSATDVDDALVFVYFVDLVIPGFVEGLGTMREGGIRKLVIPPHLGFGSQPRGPIPAYSTLVFQVNLLDTRTP